jgi:hypothetical protein
MSADFKANVVDDLGNVQPASTVTVRDVNGALIPAGELFSDAALTIPFAANPFTTDAQGNMNFFIEPQTVNITAQKGAFVKTWDDYVLNEQIDTSDFATAAQGTLADSATQPGDLGTAALVDTIDLATAAQGTLADSALQVGAGGLLQDGGLEIVSDMDNLALTTKLAVAFTNSTTGAKPSFTSGSMLSIKRVSAVGVEQLQQTAWPDNQTGNMAVRTASGGAFGVWREVWTTGNYQPEVSLGLGVVRLMKNNSGATISNNGTVSGSDLNAVFFDDLGALTQSAATGSGTWKNIGGANCSDGNSREFVRIL